MNVNTLFIGLIMIFNMVLASIVIFKERRDAGATWAWLLVLFFIPLLGFILYMLLGRQSLKRERFFQWEDLDKIGVDKVFDRQLYQIEANQFPFRTEVERRHKDLIYLNLLNNHAILTENNELELFTDGKAKFDKLFEDIEAAREYIHIQYYIIRNDRLGNELIEALTRKAMAGIKVRVLYDQLGSRGLTKRFFQKFREAGGRAEAFFPSRLRYINLRINYRNHRKLAIIDGEIGYVGGFNVGDEYLGLHPKYGYWRDTHIRVQGAAVYMMQTRFLLDWNQASSYDNIAYKPELFPELSLKGNVGIQLVTSGPVSKFEHIKNGYLRMIASARKSIYIQTPYFVPDASLLDTLRIASLSGVEVNIMIPDKSDHLFVHWASLSHVGELLRTGTKVYQYRNGFIHAKSIVIDEEIASVGTANMDLRSFKLNFEVNAFLYDADISRKLNDAFREDMKVSTLLTQQLYEQRSATVRFKESISRLLSPIL